MTDERNEGGRPPQPGRGDDWRGRPAAGGAGGDGGKEGVPETWRGYLGEQRGSPGAGEDELTPEEREFLGRNLRPRREGEPPPDEVDENEQGLTGLPRSKSEGVSFAGLIPFFIVLIVLLLGGAYYGWQTMRPRPYSTAGFGPPDKTVQVAARELFRSTQGPLDPALFVADLELARATFGPNVPQVFREPLPVRYAKVVAEMQAADFKVTAQTPLESPLSDAIQFLPYDRTDLTTGTTEQTRLWFFRTPAGWRVVGFD